jgi:LSD1 subclass zinc finger protein
MDFAEPTTQVSNQLDCKDCGALLKYAPGTEHLKCEYCGAENEIKKEKEIKIEETDFKTFIDNMETSADKQEITTVKCNNCGAASTLKPNITSDSCPFCATPLVVSSGTTSSIVKPKYLLPFKIDQKKSTEEFRKWINGLWFAPNDLKQYAQTTEKLNGMYIPYWTYDSETSSAYTGERGDYYYVTETYYAQENGKSVAKTRQVRHTRWTYVSGSVYKNFNDVLILASKSLPEEYTNKLEPWDLDNLSGFDEKFLSGFRTERYQVDVKQGFEKAENIMDNHIRQMVRQNIGGDDQRILSVNTQHDNITFKHILLPVWLSAYKYNSKVYRFMINGRTGEVQGERPYSWIKITLTVLSVLAVIAACIYFYNQYKG